MKNHYAERFILNSNAILIVLLEETEEDESKF